MDIFKVHEDSVLKKERMNEWKKKKEKKKTQSIKF